MELSKKKITDRIITKSAAPELINSVIGKIISGSNFKLDNTTINNIF